MSEHICKTVYTVVPCEFCVEGKHCKQLVATMYGNKIVIFVHANVVSCGLMATNYDNMKFGRSLLECKWGVDCNSQNCGFGHYIYVGVTDMADLQQKVRCWFKANPSTEKCRIMHTADLKKMMFPALVSKVSAPAPVVPVVAPQSVNVVANNIVFTEELMAAAIKALPPLDSLDEPACVSVSSSVGSPQPVDSDSDSNMSIATSSLSGVSSPDYKTADILDMMATKLMAAAENLRQGQLPTATPWCNISAADQITVNYVLGLRQ